MLRIRRFGIVRTASTIAVVTAIGVLALFMILAAFAVLASGLAGGDAADAPAFAIGGAGGMLVIGLIAALLYALVAWIVTAIGCALYNLVARWTGGVELLIVQQAPPPASWHVQARSAGDTGRP